VSRWRITYEPRYRPTPVSFWVHRHLDDAVWADALTFDPPLPKAIPGKGFPRLIVDAFGTELRFASPEEARHVRHVLAQRVLPTSTRLAAARGTSRGPNAHWLSRLPADLKEWRKREKLLPILDQGISALERVAR